MVYWLLKSPIKNPLLLCVILASLLFSIPEEGHAHPLRWTSQAFAGPYFRVLLENSKCRRLCTKGSSKLQNSPLREDFKRSLSSLYSVVEDEAFSEVELVFFERMKNFKQNDSLRLTDLEGLAVFAYTHRAYAELNRILRDQSRVPRDQSEDEAEIEPFCSVLISGLRKLPPIEGKVYRNTYLPSAEIEKLKMGGICRNNMFLSTSQLEPHKLREKMVGKHQFEITSKTGRSVNELSIYPSEREVLFEPGVCFEVLAVRTDDPDYELKFVLQEVSNASETEFSAG